MVTWGKCGKWRKTDNENFRKTVKNEKKSLERQKKFPEVQKCTKNNLKRREKF